MFVMNKSCEFTAAKYGIIAAKERQGVGSNQFRIEMHEDGKVAVCGLGIDTGKPGPRRDSVDPNGWSTALTSTKPLPAGFFTHVTFTRRGATCTLYIDGVEDCVAKTAGPVKHHNGEDLRFGSRLPRVGFSTFVDKFDGEIAGALYFPSCLAPSTIATLAAGEHPHQCMTAYCVSTPLDAGPLLRLSTLCACTPHLMLLTGDHIVPLPIMCSVASPSCEQRPPTTFKCSCWWLSLARASGLSKN